MLAVKRKSPRLIEGYNTWCALLCAYRTQICNRIKRKITKNNLVINLNFCYSQEKKGGFMKKLFILLFLFNMIPQVLANDAESLSQISCPDNGIRINSFTCCKDGHASYLRHLNDTFVFGEYTDISGECGCPDGGIQSKKISRDCCKNGFRYDNYFKDYASLDFESCGRPKEGYKPKGDRIGWCNDGYMYSGNTKSYSLLKPKECGCPKGSKYHKDDGGYCCQDGYELMDKGERKINFEVCGCPKGTKHAKYDVCCLRDKAGYALENKNVGGPVIEKLDFIFCGCPDGGKMINIGLPLYICCKNGYAMDEETGIYSKKESLCK